MKSEPAIDPDEPDPLTDTQLGAIADAILDGRPVDWQKTPDASDALIRQLRVLADLSGLHRTFHAGDADGAVTLSAPFPVGAKWGSLTVLERLGRGAFGEVFRAWDYRLEREVALKLLYADTEASAHPEASIREGRLLARVRHPNVITVYGAERVDGRVGIWTEFVHGRTLADLMPDAGRMNRAEAASVGIDLCRALGAVHRAGLVHGDLKAHNVMRDAGGRIVLMDFGAGRDHGAADASDTGALAGTPLYLAPELWNGGAATPQSDIYSLGVLLFHLVTGSFPVAGISTSAVQEMHRAGSRTRLRDLRPDLPRDFVAAVERALAPEPVKRFPDVEAMQVALRPTRVHRAYWLAAAGPTALLALGIAGWMDWRPATAPPHVTFQPQEWVLVTEFTNDTGEPRFDQTLRHALSNELNQSRHVNVASGARVRDALRLMAKPDDTTVDTSLGREVALRDGEIRLVVAGRVEKVAGSYVVTAQLLEAARGAVLASRRIEALHNTDLRDTTRAIANWIREQLGESRLQIEQSTRQLEKVTTPSLQALRLYSEAHDAGTAGRWQESEERVRSALIQDPTFASGHIWLAWALHNLGKPRSEYAPHARRGFELAAGTAARERHFIVGSYYSLMGKPERALPEYEELLRLYPDHPWALNNLVGAMNAVGRPRDEIAAVTARLAAGRPNDFHIQAQVTQEMVNTRGRDAARPFVERARKRIISARPHDRQHFPYIESYYLHELWVERRYAEVAAAIAVGTEPRMQDDSDAALMIRCSFHLTLGQLRRAEECFSRLRDPGRRAINLAITALARNDHDGVIERIRDYSGPDHAPVSLLVRAEALDSARRLFQRQPPVARHSEWTAAELAVAGGGGVDARRTLQAGVGGALTSVRAFLYAETLSESLVRSGEIAPAIAVLEQTAALRERLYNATGHNGNLWLRIQKRLAAVYGKAGRTEEARAIERDLLEALTSADRDHPLLLELRSLAR